ncbi:MAG: DAK2 domain-containing protein [Caldilineales bacterium]|nr:DAK2 domain-containing protein [Caldilineales bacterium]
MSPDPPVLSIDGEILLGMIGAGFAWLKQNSQIVNTLNVFPVPDGDTGTNMVLTMQSAWKMATALEKEASSASAVMDALANGAIRGARGNSGVILSQIFRGMSDVMKHHQQADAELFAGAMRQGRDTAYKGVLKPVEGTMLTVIREAADASAHAAAINPDLRFILETSVAKAQQALANTPNLLPVLKQAGVVDAGGQGLVFLFEGMNRYLRGEIALSPDEIGIGQELAPIPQPDLNALGEDEWGYDIQFLVFGDSLNEDAIRLRLLEMGGESVVVGQAGDMVKVHVHNADPGPFLSYGASLGHLDDIVLENMTLQTLQRKGEWPPASPAAPAAIPNVPDRPIFSPDCAGIVAVVSGDGLRDVFQSLGVCAVVAGGQTMNPSAEELVEAAEALPHTEIIILPNNKNVILAAKQAAGLSDKHIHVVETRSMPQGIAAMLGYNASADIDQNLASMTLSAHDIHTAEVTNAVREANINGIPCMPGDFIGLIDGQLQCRDSDMEGIMRQVLAAIDPDDDTELFTLYFGSEVRRDEAEALVEALADDFPAHDIELIYGGQPYYHFLISAE